MVPEGEFGLAMKVTFAPLHYEIAGERVVVGKIYGAARPSCNSESVL